MIRFILIALLLAFTLQAKSLNWEKDYETAKQKALKENKKILVMVSSPTCPECNYMKKEVFSQKKIKEYINKNFITYQFLHKSKEIPKQMQFWGIPRFYFTSDGSNVTAKAMGGLKSKEFFNLLEENR